MFTASARRRLGSATAAVAGAAAPGGESINPVQLAHSVWDEFLRYLFSAFPLSDPDLRDQFRRLLDRSSSLGTPLVQGPFVSLSEAFAKGDPVQQLADKATLAPRRAGADRLDTRPVLCQPKQTNSYG